MCIIVVKKSGVVMPSEQVLKNCFDYNSDGAGIMLASNGKVYGFKGLMTFKAFKSKLNQLEKRFGNLNKLPVVMHFRIGTHGTNKAENTHPFPISTNYDDLRELEWTATNGVAHNGIIHCTQTHPDVRLEDVSDTMVFIKRIIAPLARMVNIQKHTDVLDGFQIAAESKLCFLDGKGNIKILGDFNKKDGVWYSNYTYMDAYNRYGSCYSYGWSADDETFREKWGDWRAWYDSKTSSVKSIPSSTATFEEKYEYSDSKYKEAERLDLIIGDWSFEFQYDAGNGRIGSDIFTDDYAYDGETGDIYIWDEKTGTFRYMVSNDEYIVTEYYDDDPSNILPFSTDDNKN